ncbi:DUF2778 domain-containing protein [Massilia arenosa]|uniref:DUF2778 domain-containing protein n=1 Tax=Zemynaea arenosa TaxID=2561931 RepID=A0A4Y9SUA6_9BURK|nr:tlde1 domain-containing protein [Massilia arenosa]TFW30290.1 DUF2778 domain-containing protein [Massilia arenosa]
MPDWGYEQSTGNLYRDGVVVAPVAQGYSGYGSGKNNPDMQAASDLGPIPVGEYSIGPMVELHGGQVKNAVTLTPSPANQMFGRTGFFCHGDSNDHPGEASQGCIIIKELAIRQQMAASAPAILRVVRGP